MGSKVIVVAAIRPWNIKEFKAWKAPKGYRKVLVQKPEDLTLQKLQKLSPRYIFFPHWSWIIPKEVHENFECVLFHMTDLPFGRGGSPMQNLIVRGIYNTKVSAIRVASGLDRGDVYRKHPFNIKEGSAEDLFKKLSTICFGIMSDIVRLEPKPVPQKGKPVVFKRRTPAESQVPEGLSGRKLYDFIRMLDAPEYPPAFITNGSVRITLRRARMKGNTVFADAQFEPLSRK